jgi:hypothetical protein
MNIQKLMVRREVNMYGYGFEFHLAEQRYEPEKKILIAKPLEFEEHSHVVASEPAFHLDEDVTQSLFDELWALGVRPSKRLHEATPMDHIQGEVKWTRDVIDHLIKRNK